MRRRMGFGARPLLLSAAVLILCTPAFAIAVDPNDGYIWIDDSIGFNVAQNQVVFDKDVGALGSLVAVESAPDAGWVNSQPGYSSYSGPYNLALEFTSPLLYEVPSPGTANGVFSGGVGYSLIDLDNSDAVLLTGSISSATFGLVEGFNNVLFSYGDGVRGGANLTVTGGSLAPYFTNEAELVFQYWIAAPVNLQDFSTDLITGGGGSIAIYGVPEPATLLLLAGGGGLGALLRRRR